MALCIFCGEQNSEKLHEYATRNAKVFLRTMASEMDDNEMLTKLSSGDLVAIEAKYHFSCLTKFRNRYRSYLPEKNKTTIEKYEQAKARTFVELIPYIECAIEEGAYLFKVKELHEMYQNRLKDIGYGFEVNKNAFKESILRHFEEYGLQERSDSKNKIFVFPKGGGGGGQHLLKDAFKDRDYQPEALLFSKVANICRNELF